MGLFRRNDDPLRPFTKNERVLATRDLPSVPKGTAGKVKLINGIDWIRYWVFFDNGVDLGSVDGHDLIRPRHITWWQAEEARRAAEAEEAADAAAAGAVTPSGGGDAGGDGGDDDSGDSALKSMVPAHLLERSKSARQRLGA
ncbi:MAG: hypothetical protein RIE08_07025 [Acidimicrobiales bacterium]